VTALRDLSGKRALVTGAASGIGRATARRLAELGAEVIVTDIDAAGGKMVAEAVGGPFHRLDVGDPDAWDRVIALTAPIDIAFLNAGVSTDVGLPPGGAPVVEVTDAAYRRIMSINVDGVVFGTRAVLPGMIERGTGDIVATASMAGLHPFAIDPIYGLTKHAVVGFVRSIAAAFEQRTDRPDVCISAICPGFTDTSILGGELRDAIDQLGMDIMPPEDVAELVARVLEERIQGAQWVLWPGQPAFVYDWNPAVIRSDPSR
jgi:NAD(P)-dependent dehydrogenase (short-subunit alcohol dehydrogenase family)